MREDLFEWYILEPREREEALNEAIITFDANSLLTLYRLSKSDRDRVLDLLAELKERIWLAHQAAFEYQRNRLEVYYQQLDAYSALMKDMEVLRNRIVKSRAHPVLSQREIRTEISDRLVQLVKYIGDAQREQHPDDLADPLVRDGVREGLDEVFHGRVGRALNLDAKLLASAKERFDAKTPPGYEDHKKPEPDRYGDLFIWLEILEHVGSLADNRKPLILVTEEEKRDWWLTAPREGQLVGPRPELVLEAARRGVRPFWMLSLRRFYEVMTAHLKWEVPALGSYVPVGSGTESEDMADEVGHEGDAQAEEGGA